jgi:hypothetical protein
VLGPDPGIALFHLDERSGHLTPALLLALAAVIQRAFSHLFLVTAVISALSVICCLRLKEVPLRGREPRKALA